MKLQLALLAPLLGATASAQESLNLKGCHEVEPVGTEHFLYSFSGGGSGGKLLLVDAQQRPRWMWPQLTSQPHSLFYTSSGSALVTDWGNNRVLELAADGTVLWNSETVQPLSDGTDLDNPNDAQELASGDFLVCDLANHRLIELDRLGNIVWQYGDTDVPGKLTFPHGPERTASGTTLVGDSGGDRVLEIDASGNVIWTFAPTGADKMDFPRDADERADGTILVTDTYGQRLFQVDRSAGILARTPLPTVPYEADWLPNGNMLVGGGNVYEITPAGTVVWSFPPEDIYAIDTTTVANPTSGVALSVSVYRPLSIVPGERRSAVVLVPDRNQDGSSLAGEADFLAKAGFVSVLFDPDGRGQSTAGGTYTVEDWGGTIHQDGLQQVLLHVASRPEVDPSRIVVASYGYGLVMASGCLARHALIPPVALLRDWEGPAGREHASTSTPGGFVPFPLSDTVFWSTREARTFLPTVKSPYLREQTAVDHSTASPSDNRHAIECANLALHAAFGGAGRSLTSRVNFRSHNPSDVAYGPSLQPTWVAESIDWPHWDVLHLWLEMEDRFQAPRVQLQSPPVPGTIVQADIVTQSAWAGRVWGLGLSLGPDPIASAASILIGVGVLDAQGLGGMPLPIPSDPILSGLVAFLQAAVVVPGEPIPYVPGPYEIVVLP